MATDRIYLNNNRPLLRDTKLIRDGIESLVIDFLLIAGGGAGGYADNTMPPQKGGGGGGAGGAAPNGGGGAGGSGIVLLRFLTTDLNNFTITGGTSSTNGSYTIITFTSNGNLILS